MQVKVLGKVIGAAESWSPITTGYPDQLRAVFYDFLPVEALANALSDVGSLIIDYTAGIAYTSDNREIQLLPLLSTKGL